MRPGCGCLRGLVEILPLRLAGEGSHLHWSSSADDPYSLDPASGEGFERVPGHVRLAQYVDVCEEGSRNV